MPDIKFIEVKIDDICDVVGEDSKLTKTYINQHKGEYPVYSATLGTPFGYIDSYKYNEKILAVVNYGDSGKTYLMDGKYNIGRNICGLKPKIEYKDNLLLEYVKAVATEIFIKKAKGNKHKNLNQGLIKETVITVPVNQDGSFDIEKQRQLSKQYEDLEKKKSQLLNKRETLNQTTIILNDIIKSTKNVSLNDLFKIERGNSQYTKTYCNENQGEYPVYSANNSEMFGSIDTHDYEGEYLTISVNGIAGIVTIINGKFSCNADRVVLKLIQDNIDINYIKYVAQPIFRANARGRKGINGENEFTKLPMTILRTLNIPIPIKEDGEYDLEKQIEISKKYMQIEQIKESVSNKIDEVISIMPTVK